MKDWASVFRHEELDLFLVVYVDDFKMSGPAKNIAEGWALISKVTEAGMKSASLEDRAYALSQLNQMVNFHKKHLCSGRGAPMVSAAAPDLLLLISWMRVGSSDLVRRRAR